MHIVYQNEIVRGHDIRAAAEALGWSSYEIETNRFDQSVAEIDRSLFKAALDPNDHIMVFGTIRLAAHRKYRSLSKLQSGVIADDRKLRWSAYATYLPNEMLLNPFGIMFPWGYLKDPKVIGAVKNAFGEDGVFIRPNSPWKPFAGFDTSWDLFEYNLNSYAQLEHIDPGEICVLFPRKQIDKVEWRFWVVSGQISTFSPYSWTDVPSGTTEPPDGMLQAVENAIGKLDGFEDSMVIDMVQSADGCKIVELNGLSTAGFYEGMNVGDLLSSLPHMFG